MNRRTDGTPSDVAVSLRELGLNNPAGYRVEVSIDVIFCSHVNGFSKVLNMDLANFKGFYVSL